MPRRQRKDFPGAWWHVMNRGVAKRSLFETRQDYRYFLALIARAVRRGEIEVHAYCLMPTHFHLLVRSPLGQLSTAMQRIQDLYARRFNRRRDRDGPLFRGRFRAKQIHDMAYRRAVFHYVHDNPVAAGLIGEPGAHPYSSAWHYARTTRPPWLSINFGRHVLGRLNQPTPCRELVERWLSDHQSHVRAVERLVRSTPDHIRRWLQSRARLADGATAPRTFLLDRTLMSVIEAERRARPEAWPIRLGSRSHCGWGLVHAGLLRTACGLSLQAIAARTDATVSRVHARVHRHRRALLEDARYARRCAELVRACLRKDYPNG